MLWSWKKQVEDVLPELEDPGICWRAERNILVDVSKNCRTGMWTEVRRTSASKRKLSWSLCGNAEAASHLCDSGLLLLELTEPEDASSWFVVELLLEGMQQLHLLAKAGRKKTECVYDVTTLLIFSHRSSAKPWLQDIGVHSSNVSNIPASEAA